MTKASEFAKLELTEKEINNTLRFVRFLLKGGKVECDGKIFQAFPTTNKSGPKMAQIVHDQNGESHVLGLDAQLGDLFNMAQKMTEEEAVGNVMSTMTVGELRGK